MYCRPRTKLCSIRTDGVTWLRPHMYIYTHPASPTLAALFFAIMQYYITNSIRKKIFWLVSSLPPSGSL